MTVDVADGPNVSQTVAIWDNAKFDQTITPREAFYAGWEARGRAHGSWDGPATTIELAWEHFQAERMKAAASTERKAK